MKNFVITNSKTLKDMKNALRETIRRCHHSGHPQYVYYGARGITVCQEWRDSFDAFVADMGIRPEGMTLERRNNSLGYAKANCKWATRAEQAANRRSNKLVTWEGKTRTVADWEREKGFKPGTLKARLGSVGYNVREAFTKVVKCGAKSPNYSYKKRNRIDPEKRAPRAGTPQHKAHKRRCA